MGIKIVVGVLLIVAFLVSALIWYLSRPTTNGKPTVGDGSIFTPKPGSGRPASNDLGDYLIGIGKGAAP